MSRSKVVILDAGHGGINPVTGRYVTSGKRSPVWPGGSVYYEGVGNRDIVKRAARLLADKGWKVLYTVNPDGFQDVALGNRVKISNQHYAQNIEAFQVSVHSNGASASAHGAEVWTWPGQSKSDKMAEIWFQEHGKMFPGMAMRAEKSDGDSDKESLFTMNSVNCPSFLIESMFHSNEAECRILMSSEGRQKVAQAIANACERIFNEL